MASKDPLPLRFYGDPVLRRKADALPAVTPDVRDLIEAMFATMYAEEGVGLAAPQVGRSVRVFVVDVEEEVGARVKQAFVNPKIVERSGEIVGEEGCLSIPGLRADVKRAARVVVEALDADGNPFRLEAEGLLARALQHEQDHLDGVLFLDRLGPITRRLLEAKWKRVRPSGEDVA
ncbi:MAG TPA: peptide deformylase [Acidobacteriota bacterium]|nr:peptide deformylase [Acidobacteriota bacterium]